MITEAILQVIIVPINWLLNLFPSIDLSIPDNLYGNISSIFKGLGYFFPVRLVVSLFMVSFVINNWQIGVALFNRIKSFIPSISGS